MLDGYKSIEKNQGGKGIKNWWWGKGRDGRKDFGQTTVERLVCVKQGVLRVRSQTTDQGGRRI